MAVDALVENGRELIEQHYSWRSCGAELERTLAGLARDEHGATVDRQLPHARFPRREKPMQIAASEGESPHA